MLLHYLVKRENAKIAFSLKCYISALPEFNQLLDFFNGLDSRFMLRLLYDFLSLVINAVSRRDCWGHGSGERKSIALQQLTVLHAQCTSALYSGFPISQGNAEALDRCSGETEHHMIFLLSTFSVTFVPKIIVIGSCMSRF